jgi:hypothetical protein
VISVKSQRLASIKSLEVVLTGRFVLGTQSDIQRRARAQGAIVSDKTVRSTTDVVVIGSPSGHWKYYDHGIKIEDALQRRRHGQKIYMISEGEFYQLLNGKGLTHQQSEAALSSGEPSFAGLPYREAAMPEGGKGSITVDLDARDRSTRAHQQLCNRLAKAVKNAGYEPLSPFTGGPEYDVAWMRGDRLWVAEVKSVSTTSERQQIRLGLGQVLDYTTSMRSFGFDVQPVVAITSSPSSKHFEAVCREAGVILCWPDNLQSGLSL